MLCNKNKVLLLFLTLCTSTIVNVVVGQGQSGGDGGGGGGGGGMGNGGGGMGADGSICNICGEGNTNFRPTNPDAIVSIPDRGDVTCRQLAVGGANGNIPAENCPTIVELAKEPCGCTEFDGNTSGGNGGGGMMGGDGMGQQHRRPGNRQDIMGHMVSVYTHLFTTILHYFVSRTHTTFSQFTIRPFCCLYWIVHNKKYKQQINKYRDRLVVKNVMRKRKVCINVMLTMPRYVSMGISVNVIWMLRMKERRD